MQTSSADPVPVAICCAHRLFRDALAAALSARPEFTVVGDVGDPDDLLPLCRLRATELVLCCADDELGRSVAALAAVRAHCAGTRLVLIYRELSRAGLVATRHAGVDTLIPCSHGLDALLIVLGRHHADLRPPGREHGAPAGPSTVLTDREQNIVALLAAGHPVGRIADLLGVDNRVVENHKRRIYQKLDVASQSHLAARAATLGLAGRPPAIPHHHDRPAGGMPPALLHHHDRPGGGMPLVVLHGADGPIRHDIEVALFAAHVPFVLAPAGEHADPRMIVVIDGAVPDRFDSPDADVCTLLVRSSPMSRDEAVAALAHGVAGVLAAAEVSAALVPALQLAASGHLTLEPTTGAALVAAGTGWGETEHLPELTVREGDILRSIARGHTVRQTARSLGIAEKTVENTQARLFRKLGARNRAGALATVHALGLLELLDDTTAPYAPLRR